MKQIQKSFLWLACLVAQIPYAHAILAGGEFILPADRPSSRLDPLGINSPFNFVGALSIYTESQTYYCTAVALSPNWVLTAGHNVDFNDDGVVDDNLLLSFYLNGVNVGQPTSVTPHPNFSGFGNPSVYNDLSLLYFGDSFYEELFYPLLGIPLEVGDEVSLVGYGRSGYGNYGYTTSAASGDGRGGKQRVDYKEVLSPEDFALFAKLRDWRKATAEQEGIPVYAVLTNEQLAAIATKRPETAAQLREVEGVGEGKAGKYAEGVLGVVTAPDALENANAEEKATGKEADDETDR